MKNKSSSSELSVPISALHTAQEQWEAEYLRRNELEYSADNLQRKLNGLFERFPSTVLIEERALAFGSKSPQGAPSTEITFRSVESLGRSLETCRVILSTSKDGASVSLAGQLKGKKGSEEQRSTQHKGADRLDLELKIHRDRVFSIKEIDSLTSLDFRLVKNLLREAHDLVSEAEPRSTDEEYAIQQSASSLAILNSYIDKSTESTRYESLDAEFAQPRPHYQGLSITLKHICLGSRWFSKLRYTLSTVDHDEAQFGKNPRLEFYEDTQTAFSRWFVETDDSSGKRLELRFAPPTHFDTRVWQKICARDQVTIAAIVASLPHQIAEALIVLRAKEQTHWIDLANSVRTTLARAFKSGTIAD